MFSVNVSIVDAGGERLSMNAPTRPIPDPGSAQAVKAGCVCPVEQNHAGEAPPDRGQWWVAYDCKIHSGWLGKR